MINSLDKCLLCNHDGGVVPRRQRRSIAGSADKLTLDECFMRSPGHMACTTLLHHILITA
jgi:hypothetical protein